MLFYFLSQATNRFTDMGCERGSKVIHANCMRVSAFSGYLCRVKSLYIPQLVSSGVQKPKSYAAPAGDPGIGLEQLELMCKVQNIVSLQLYGDEEASAIKVKTFNIDGSSYLSRKKKSGQKKKK